MRLNFDSQEWKFNVYSKTANKKKKRKYNERSAIFYII